MKKQIFNLIDSYAGMWYSDKSKLSKQIEALMCYREVKAIIQGRETVQLHNGADFLIHGILKFDYPEDVIEKAIEQYKSENK